MCQPHSLSHARSQRVSPQRPDRSETVDACRANGDDDVGYACIIHQGEVGGAVFETRNGVFAYRLLGFETFQLGTERG
jgi:hypothetical protein